MIERISDELIENVLAVLKINDSRILSSLKKVIYDASVTYVARYSYRNRLRLLKDKSQKSKVKQMAHLSRKLLNVSKDIEWEYLIRSIMPWALSTVRGTLFGR